MKADIINERQYLHDPAPMNTLAVDIEPAPPTAALERAIRAAVEHHPLLGCKAVQSAGGAAYFMTTPEPGYTVYAAELEDESDWRIVAADVEQSPFETEQGELVRFGLIEGEKKTILVISLHRIVGDASCLAEIARDVIAELNTSGSLGEPLHYRAPAEPKAVKLPMMTRTMSKMMNKRWAQYGKPMNYDDYLLLCESYWQRGAETAEYVFTREETARLNALAKSGGAHLGALVAAALVLAQEDSGNAGYARGVRGGEKGMADCEKSVVFGYDLANSLELVPCAGQIAQAIRERFASDEEDNQAAFMRSLEPTLIDASWYSAFGGYGDLMAAQARDMFGLIADRAFNITDLGAVEPGGERFRAAGAHFLPRLSSTARMSVGMLINGGRLAVAAQFPTAEGYAPQDELFLDAMARLKEAADAAE